MPFTTYNNAALVPQPMDGNPGFLQQQLAAHQQIIDAATKGIYFGKNPNSGQPQSAGDASLSQGGMYRDTPQPAPDGSQLAQALTDQQNTKGFFDSLPGGGQQSGSMSSGQLAPDGSFQGFGQSGGARPSMMDRSAQMPNLADALSQSPQADQSGGNYKGFGSRFDQVSGSMAPGMSMGQQGITPYGNPGMNGQTGAASWGGVSPAAFNVATGNFGNQPAILPQGGQQGGQAPQQGAPQAGGGMQMGQRPPMPPQGAQGPPPTQQSDPYGVGVATGNAQQQAGQAALQLQAQQADQARLAQPVAPPNAYSLASQGVPQSISLGGGMRQYVPMTAQGQASAERQAASANLGAQLTSAQTVAGGSQDTQAMIAELNDAQQASKDLQEALQKGTIDQHTYDYRQALNEVKIATLQRQIYMGDQRLGISQALLGLRGTQMGNEAAVQGNTITKDYETAGVQYQKAEALFKLALPSKQYPDGNPAATRQLGLMILRTSGPGSRASQQLAQYLGTPDPSVPGAMLAMEQKLRTGTLPPEQVQALHQTMQDEARTTYQIHQNAYNHMPSMMQNATAPPDAFWGANGPGGGQQSGGGNQAPPTLIPITGNEWNQIKARKGLSDQQMTQYYSRSQ